MTSGEVLECEFNTVQARWCSGSTGLACSTGRGFESRPGHYFMVTTNMKSGDAVGCIEATRSQYCRTEFYLPYQADASLA